MMDRRRESVSSTSTVISPIHMMQNFDFGAKKSIRKDEDRKMLQISIPKSNVADLRMKSFSTRLRSQSMMPGLKKFKASYVSNNSVIEGSPHSIQPGSPEKPKEREMSNDFRSANDIKYCLIYYKCCYIGIPLLSLNNYQMICLQKMSERWHK